ncbi:hypothetical protein KW783_02710 [Candidatus Parcubacteria bacterium]|nr:hypothetical protein [Candidatus Parcubacteria bacterium]
MHQIQTQVQTAGTITGFNYAFSKTLTDRLKKMVETKEVVVDYEREHWIEDDDDEKSLTLSLEAIPVVGYLSEQVKFWRDPNSTKVCVSIVRDLLKTAEAFLANFEEKSA